jgi:hypothetical protein
MDSKTNHPFYCVWCGRVLPTKSAFDKHYAEELAKEDKPTPAQVFDLMHNENHY